MTWPEAPNIHKEIAIPGGCLRLYSGFPGLRPTYALVAASYRGKWVWGRKAGRSTWEFPGGHLEPGETPDQAAGRELEEEAGALEYTLEPLLTYSVIRESPDGKPGAETFGRLYRAKIFSFKPLGHEIVETRLFEGLPERLSYPDIQPHLFHLARTLPGKPEAGTIP